MWSLTPAAEAVASLTGWGVFVRRVKTASGATAVQIVHKRGREVLRIEHIGSAHGPGELALLLQIAQERVHAGQQVLDLDALAGHGGPDGAAAGRPSAVVEGTASLILWEVLNQIYDDLGLPRVRDEAFRALVLARVIEPVSKLDTVRVLGEIGRRCCAALTWPPGGRSRSGSGCG